MHYKNGRRVTLGDWVVGKTHNSQGVIVGIVIDMMPQQGPCNIKIHRWEGEQNYDAGVPEPFIPAQQTRGREDYGDANEFILAADGLRMVSAILGYGNWDGPYL
jgi:hypothetical protein